MNSITGNQKPIYITTSTGLVKGAVWPDGVLRIDKQESHYVKKDNLGYGVDPATITDAKASGAHDIEIKAHTGKSYRVSITNFEYYATRRDIGRGEQYFMTIRSLQWLVNHKPTYKNQPLQISMFGG